MKFQKSELEMESDDISDYITLSNEKEKHIDNIKGALNNGKQMDVSISLPLICMTSSLYFLASLRGFVSPEQDERDQEDATARHQYTEDNLQESRDCFRA